MKFEHLSPWRCECGWNRVLQTDGQMICENPSCSVRRKWAGMSTGTESPDVVPEPKPSMGAPIREESGRESMQSNLGHVFHVRNEYPEVRKTTARKTRSDELGLLTRLGRVERGWTPRSERLAFGEWPDKQPTEIQRDTVLVLQSELGVNDDYVNKIATMATGRSITDWECGLTRGELSSVIGILHERKALRRR